MRGSSQSQLVLGSDGNFWVVKFQNNPEHVRVLANEMIGTRIASALGHTVAPCSVIHVSSRLIEADPALTVRGAGGVRVKCISGRHFASKLAGGRMPGRVVDYLPETCLQDVPNLHELSGMLAFDKWTGNSDTRQAVFCRDSSRRRYRATFIDQGHCFNGGKWTFPDMPLFGMFRSSVAYARVSGWDAFEPWLQRIEEFSAEKLWSIACDVPSEWYEGDSFALERLTHDLLRRRNRVRLLIDQIAKSDRSPFPLWRQQGRQVPVSDPNMWAKGPGYGGSGDIQPSFHPL